MYAAARGYRYAPSEVERALYEHLDMDLLLATHPKARSRLRPLARPWIPAAQAAAAPKITPALRERLRAVANRALRRGNA